MQTAGVRYVLFPVARSVAGKLVQSSLVGIEGVEERDLGCASSDSESVRAALLSNIPWGVECSAEGVREELIRRIREGIVQPYEVWLALLHAADGPAR